MTCSKTKGTLSVIFLSKNNKRAGIFVGPLFVGEVGGKVESPRSWSFIIESRHCHRLVGAASGSLPFEALSRDGHVVGVRDGTIQGSGGLRDSRCSIGGHSRIGDHRTGTVFGHRQVGDGGRGLGTYTRVVLPSED